MEDRGGLGLGYGKVAIILRREGTKINITENECTDES